MSDEAKNQQYQQAIQQALIEHLIDSGVIDSETFKETMVKWQKKLGLEPINNPLDFISKLPKPPEMVSTESFSGSKPMSVTKIMIIDNVKFIRDLIRSTLANQGYSHFVEGENGQEAFELFQKEKPDIVIMDIEMKGMNGLDALREIRKEDKNTPVIIMTGNPTENYVKLAVEFGMTDFVAKPLDVNRLISVIQKRLGQQ